MIQTFKQFQIDEFAQVPIYQQIADKIKVDAKASTAFVDKSGRLRRSIKRRKSKFDDGGYMVKAGGKGAMQAWLVEHGHAGPTKASPRTPPHPFLRPALNRNEGMK